MTLEKIVEEIEKRIQYLEEKEEKYRKKAHQYQMSDDEYWSLPQDHPKKRKYKESYAKVDKVQNEKDKLRDMLYEYDKSRL